MGYARKDMRTVAVYTLSRLALFAATFAVLYLLGARGLLAIALSVLISGLISFVLLSRQRDAVSGSVSGAIRRTRERTAEFSARLDEGAAAEDDEEPAATEAPRRQPRA